MIRRINLIPPSERLRTQTDFGMLGLVVLAVVVVAGIALSYVFFNGTLTDRKRELESGADRPGRSQLAALAQYETLGNQRRDAEEGFSTSTRTYSTLPDVGRSSLQYQRSVVAAVVADFAACAAEVERRQRHARPLR